MLDAYPFTVSSSPAARTSRRGDRSLVTPPPSVAAVAGMMLDELRAHRLEVILVPDRRYDGVGNDFRRLRCAESQNAPWYQDFCGRYESNRRRRGFKFKTRIKRRETEAALARILRGGG